MKVIVLITLCLFAILSLARAGEHGHIHAVAGEFGYKVDVKHPTHVAGDHKGHHTFVEDKGVQEQYIKVGIYPHVEAHGYEEGHDYGYH